MDKAVNVKERAIIAVTQRVDLVAQIGEVRDSLDQRIAEWMLSAGFLLAPIPNALSTLSQINRIEINDWLLTINPTGLILSGGNDIGQCKIRDELERHLLSWAFAKKIPVLGICRGLQMMAAWSGVGLVKCSGHVGERHQLTVDDNHDEWPKEVNSYHRWSLAGCPSGFMVTARSEDGSIEAIRHKDLPWEGWMWHPERESVYSDCDTKRLKRLFNGNAG